MPRIAVLTLLLLIIWSLSSCTTSKNTTNHNEHKYTLDQLAQKFEATYVSDYSSGLALVFSKSKKFIASDQGKRVFDYPYRGNSIDFKNDFAIVTKGILKGMINKNGDIVVPIEYISISQTSKNLYKCIHQDLRRGVLDLNTKVFHEIPTVDAYSTVMGTSYITTRKAGNFGVVNLNNELVIPHIYTKIRAIRPGVFIACKNDLCGVIDSENNTIIDFIYEDLLCYFSDTADQIIAKSHNNYGIVSTTNDTLVPFEYNIIRPTPTSLYIYYQNREVGLIDTTLSIIPIDKAVNIRHKHGNLFDVAGQEESYVYNSKTKTKTPLTNLTKNQQFVFFKEDDKFGVKDKNGMLIHPAIFDTKPRLYNSGYQVAKDGKKNILTSDGSLMLPTFYDKIYKARNACSVKMDNKYGVANHLGELVVPIIYDRVTFEAGLILAKKNKLYYLIDFHGNTVLSDLDNLELKRDLLFTEKNGSFKIYSLDLEILYESKDRFYLSDNISANYIGIQLNNDSDYENLYDLVKRSAISKKYKAISHPSYFNERVIVKSHNNKYGILTINQEIVLDTIYDSIIELNHDIGKRYMTVIDKKKGILSSGLEVLTPPLYHDCQPLGAGMLSVSNGEKVGVVTNQHDTIVPFIYDSYQTSNPSYDRISARVKNKWCLLDLQGNELIPPVYDHVKTTVHGKVLVETNGKFGMYSLSGRQLIPPSFDKISTIYGDYIRVTKDGKVGLYETTRGIHIPPICTKIDHIFSKDKDSYSLWDGYRLARRFSGLTIKYQDYEFTVDLDFKCTENCPPNEVIEKLITRQ